MLVVRLRFDCMRERLRGKRRILVAGCLRHVRTSVWRLTQVPVAAGTRTFKVRFRYSGKARSATVLLRRCAPGASRWAGLDSNQGPTDYELGRTTSGSVDVAAVSEGCFSTAGLHLPSWDTVRDRSKRTRGG